MIKAQSWFFFLALVPLFFSCSEPKDRVRIVGEISGIKMADFYVYNEDGVVNDIDTVKIVGGEFRYERELSQPAILTFLYPNFSRTYVIAEPGKKLKIKGQASKLSGLDVSGSKENELLTKFREQNVGKPEKELQMAAAQFVRDHNQTMAAVAVFKRYFVQVEHHNAAVALPLLEKLKKSQPKNPAVSSMYDLLKSEMQTASGKMMPEFKAVTVSGDTITLKDFKDKPTLVVFWAPWSGESYQLLRTVSKIERKYLDKMHFLLVSVDYEKRPSEVRVRQEGIEAPLVCEEHGFASPLAKTLGVRLVPGNLLVSADGEIVKRDLPMKDLEKNVEKLIK